MKDTFLSILGEFVARHRPHLSINLSDVRERIRLRLLECRPTHTEIELHFGTGTLNETIGHMLSEEPILHGAPVSMKTGQLTGSPPSVSSTEFIDDMRKLMVVRLGCEDNWNEIGKRLAFEICKDELQVRGIGQKKSSKDGRIRVAQIARYGNHIRSLILWKCPDLKPISNAELANTIIPVSYTHLTLPTILLV